MNKINLDQKAMLAQYEKVYQNYNSMCAKSDMPNKLAMQNRGALYSTGYRCLVNFCTAYHRNQADGYQFTSSAALLAQDWGKKQQPKTIRRHLIRLAKHTKLNPIPMEEPLKIGIPLFTQLEEFWQGNYKNVRLWLNPCFIVFAEAAIQAQHAKDYPLPSWKPPPQKQPSSAGADKPRKIAPNDGEASDKVRGQIANRLASRFKVSKGKSPL